MSPATFLSANTCTHTTTHATRQYPHQRPSKTINTPPLLSLPPPTLLHPPRRPITPRPQKCALAQAHTPPQLAAAKSPCRAITTRAGHTTRAAPAVPGDPHPATALHWAQDVVCRCPPRCGAAPRCTHQRVRCDERRASCKWHCARGICTPCAMPRNTPAQTCAVSKQPIPSWRKRSAGRRAASHAGALRACVLPFVGMCPCSATLCLVLPKPLSSATMCRPCASGCTSARAPVVCRRAHRTMCRVPCQRRPGGQ